VPKQFCSLLNGPSLVDEALRRAPGIAAPERVFVVAAKHRRWWKSLAGLDVMVRRQEHDSSARIAFHDVQERQQNAVRGTAVLRLNDYVLRR
jgi:mannose-1-phosphate guanylyltransferase